MHPFKIAIIALALGCAKAPSVAVQHIATASTVANCAAPRTFGAIPDDGLDDRVSLQAALSACVGRLALEAGRYDLVTPPYPRARAMLALGSGVQLEGVGDATELSFQGDAGGGEWRGVQVASNTAVRRMRVTASLTHTVEQTHLFRGDGPLRGVELSYLYLDTNVTSEKGGDAANFAGYEPLADGTQDRTIWDVSFHHNRVGRLWRSVFASHGGLHHARIFDNKMGWSMDQRIDTEGDTGGSDDLEISDNDFPLAEGNESALAIQIQMTSRLHLHHNTIAGAIDLYGCDRCVLDHNTVDLVVPTGIPVVSLRKAGTGAWFHDELYSRQASAGPGYVFSAAQKVTAPDHVSLDAVRLVQHAPFGALYAWGVIGLTMRHLAVVCDWAAGIRADAVAVSGSSSTTGIRTTDISLTDSDLNGPYLSGIAVGGSYAGTGTVEVLRTKSTGVAHGLRCDGIATGSGITGPVAYTGNWMPAATCAPLVP